jgi:hypothetical protein
MAKGRSASNVCGSGRLISQFNRLDSIMNEEGRSYKSKEYTIQVVSDIKGVEKIRTVWEKMQWHPNADPDFYLSVVKARSEILRPSIRIVRYGGIPKAILIGRIEQVPFRCEIGYRTVYKSLVRQLTIVYGGVLGYVSCDIARSLVSELTGGLNRNEVDIVFFNHLGIDSNVYQQLKAVPGFMCRDHFPDRNLHYRLSVQNSFDAFLASLSRNTRENLKRYEKRLLREYGSVLSIRCYRNKNEIDPLMVDMESIASKTYQRGLGVGFRADAENRLRMSVAFERQWLRVYVLYIEEKPCAFWSGYSYGSTFFIDIPGYDPDYSEYRIGNFLHMRMLEDLLQNENLKYIDYGFGDARYKRSYCNECWQESSLYIFPFTLLGARLNFLRSVTIMANRLANVTAKRLGLLEKVKRHWRDRLRHQ